MKKLMLLLIAAVAGYAVWKKYTERNTDRDLWSEVTDALE